MSERSEIKETCSCGAIFTYSETVNEPYFSKLASRQQAFHEAHAKCLQLSERVRANTTLKSKLAELELRSQGLGER